MFESLRWRLVGPHRGGRVVAVAGDPRDPQTFYFGACAGGVWKTDDAGQTWQNVSDGYFRSAAVGALAVADADPNVVYAGMGECSIRNNVVAGDGVYRSTDAGRTWTHLGLADTRHIGRIRVHPQDPDLLYVAALGHAFGPNAERGVFRSRDGGRTWDHVLSRSPDAGCVDLAMDPANPRLLYAGFWEARRYPWGLSSGGPGSGLWASRDGGDTWTDLSARPGLPGGLCGKIGVAASPARPGRVWALIEADDGGLFRSDDAGDTWRRVSAQRDLRQRAFYYSHVIADPGDAETVYVLNLQMWRSDDGGTNFVSMPTPHSDNHDLWIDPANPRRWIQGNDGGACISFNAGDSWSSIYNQPTAQFYHVATDNAFPYRLYGSQQDNTTVAIASRSPLPGITAADWYPVGGGENGYIAVRPDDPNVVYAGDHVNITRYHHISRQARQITVWPERPSGWGAKDLKYRFQWTFPVVLSPHDPGVLYATAQYVLRSTDEGESWEKISPDLTRAEPSTMEPSGGPITKDNSGAEYYATIFAFAESPVRPGLLWAGSDDGLIHVSRDGGRSWENVTPPAALLPEWALISIIEPSPHAADAAYIAATRYRLDDPRPYLLKTEDGGRTWRAIAGNLPDGAFTRVVRADPERPGLLYCGTEHGVYASLDDGAAWHPLQANLPLVPIHDLAVKDGDLVAATHGRSFWILDDVTPLRHWRSEVATAAAHLYPVRTVHRVRGIRGPGGFLREGSQPGRVPIMAGGTPLTLLRRRGPDGQMESTLLDAGTNPPEGALIHYSLRRAPSPGEEVTLSICAEDGSVIRRFSNLPEDGRAPVAGGRAGGPPRLPAAAGDNRFVWDLCHPGARGAEGVPPSPAGQGPLVPPGTYRVRLVAAGTTSEQTLEVRRDPRVEASDGDLREQAALLLQIRDKLIEVQRAIANIRETRTQVSAWVARSQGRSGSAAVTEAGQRLVERLDAVEGGLIQVRARAPQDALNYPVMLDAKLLALARSVEAADARPTRQQREAFADLAARADARLGELAAAMAAELTAFQASLGRADLPPIVAEPAGDS